MSKSIIVLDTNIIARNPYLKAEEWANLHAQTDHWRLRFIVPEVVLMETVNVVRRLWKPERDRLAGFGRWAGALGKTDELQSLLSAADARYHQYESDLSARLLELGVEVTQLPASIDHMDIARRASERRAPYIALGSSEDAKVKDGYRDTLIWLTVLEVAKANPDCDVWFVSNNYSDFGAKHVDKNPQDTRDYPLEWHADLYRELDSKGIAARVFYARGLERLTQHLLAKFAPLPDNERDELWMAVEQDQLDRNLTKALIGLDVDPRSAALPLDTLSAVVIATVRSAGAIRLSEAAHRAAGAWTVRFKSPINATLEITSDRENVIEESKELIVSGRLEIGVDGTVSELVVEAVEASADDPQRKAWARADADRALGASSARIRKFVRDQLRVAPGFRVGLDEMVSREFRVGLDEMVSREFRVGLDEMVSRNFRVGLEGGNGSEVGRERSDDDGEPGREPGEADPNENRSEDR